MTQIYAIAYTLLSKWNILCTGWSKKQKKLLGTYLAFGQPACLTARFYIKSAYFPLSPTTEYEHIGGPIHI